MSIVALACVMGLSCGSDSSEVAADLDDEVTLADLEVAAAATVGCMRDIAGLQGVTADLELDGVIPGHSFSYVIPDGFDGEVPEATKCRQDHYNEVAFAFEAANQDKIDQVNDRHIEAVFACLREMGVDPEGSSITPEMVSTGPDPTADQQAWMEEHIEAFSSCTDEASGIQGPVG